MTKPARVLNAEIEDALADDGKAIRLDKLYAWRPKVDETLDDIRQGRTSRSTGKPLVVSQLDAPRGAFWIIDGHHRAIEAAQAGAKTVYVVIDPNVPRIERTGGAYASVLGDRIRIVDAVAANDLCAYCGKPTRKGSMVLDEGQTAHKVCHNYYEREANR